MNLQEFIKSPLRNSYIKEGKVICYVRKSRRLYEGNKLIAVLDIANVEVPEKFRNRGLFKEFVRKVKEVGLPVYIECIHNPAVFNVAYKAGFVPYTYGSPTPSLYPDMIYTPHGCTV